MKTDDKLIAEFMGFNKNVFEPEFYVLPSPYNSDGPFCSCEFLRFANSWDWLMPVVEKIEKIEGVSVIIKKSRCRILIGKKVFSCHTIVKLNSMYRVVVEFIQWYNQQKNDSPSS